MFVVLCLILITLAFVFRELIRVSGLLQKILERLPPSG